MAGGAGGARPAVRPGTRHRVRPPRAPDAAGDPRTARGLPRGGPPPVKLILVGAAAVLAALLGLSVGAVPVSPGEIITALTDPTAPHAAIVRDLRLPRVLLGFVLGGALAVCGAALQALLRNSLADPYLLGLSGG